MADRIRQRFYWPTLFWDVERFCQSCQECQKYSTRRGPRAPMVPLPIIQEPFKRIAMYVLGPLPRSRSGNRFILVICDYATRYPEGIPLKSIDAEHVAEALVTLFSRQSTQDDPLPPTNRRTGRTFQSYTEIDATVDRSWGWQGLGQGSALRPVRLQRGSPIDNRILSFRITVWPSSTRAT